MAIEFAILAPFFLILVIGTMVFALYFATLVAVIHSATEGARASIPGLSATDRATLARARITTVFQGYSPLLNPARATVTAAPGTDPTTFKVQVSYPISDFNFQWFYNLLAITGGGGTAPSTIAHSVTVANGGY